MKRTSGYVSLWEFYSLQQHNGAGLPGALICSIDKSASKTEIGRPADGGRVLPSETLAHTFHMYFSSTSHCLSDSESLRL